MISDQPDETLPLTADQSESPQWGRSESATKGQQCLYLSIYQFCNKGATMSLLVRSESATKGQQCLYLSIYQFCNKGTTMSLLVRSESATKGQQCLYLSISGIKPLAGFHHFCIYMMSGIHNDRYFNIHDDTASIASESCSSSLKEMCT